MAVNPEMAIQGVAVKAAAGVYDGCFGQGGDALPQEGTQVRHVRIINHPLVVFWVQFEAGAVVGDFHHTGHRVQWESVPARVGDSCPENREIREGEKLRSVGFQMKNGMTSGFHHALQFGQQRMREMPRTYDEVASLELAAFPCLH